MRHACRCLLARFPGAILVSGFLAASPAWGQDFTIPESKLLDPEFASSAWGGPILRADGPGDGVDFTFLALQASSTGVKDDYPVDTVYGQILPSHGNGDFSNFTGYSLNVENLDDQPVMVSLFLNTGFTGPSGTPPNNPANDTFWQSEWVELAPGARQDLYLCFGNAIPWNIEDNPLPHTQGSEGVATSINSYDRTEFSAIGFQVAAFVLNPEAVLRVRPGPPDRRIDFLEIGADALYGWGPPEPLTHPGTWGDLANGGYGAGTSGDNLARVVWASDYDGDLFCEYGDPDPRSGTVTLDYPASTAPVRVVVRHLDGYADDSFSLYVLNPNTGKEVLVGSYLDQFPDENWVVSEFDLPACLQSGGSDVGAVVNRAGGNAMRSGFRGLGAGGSGGTQGGSLQLRFEAPGASWASFCPYGQLAIDWVELRGYCLP